MGYGWNVQRVGDANDVELLGRAFEHFAPHRRPADPDHRRQPHRLGRADQAGHQRRARRTARRGRDPRRQAPLRLAGGREVPRARRRPRALRRRHRRPRRRTARRLAGALRRVPEAVPRARRSRRAHAAARAAGGMGQGPADVPRRRQGPRQPRLERQGAQRHRQERALVHRRRRRSLSPSTKTRLTFDGAGDFEADNYGGRNFHFGIREHGMCAILNGMSLSKVRPFGSGFFIFTDYARPSIRLARVDGAAGRSSSSPTTRSASARTGRRISRSSSSPRCAPSPICSRCARRRQRGGRGVARHHAAAARAGDAGAVAAEPADARSHEVRAGAGLAQGAYVLADPPQGGTRRAAARHRQRGRALRRPPTRSSPSAASRRAWSACRAGSCSSGSRRRIATGAAAVDHRPRRRRAGLDARLGPLRRPAPAPSSACGPSAPRHR